MTEIGYDIGIEAQEGDHEGPPSLVTIAWENTDDVKNLASFFTVVKGAIAVSEAQCITHKVSMIERRAVKIYEFWIPIYGSRFVRISILMSTNMCFDFDQSYRLANFQISTKCKASFPALFENICLFSNKIRIKTYFS